MKTGFVLDDFYHLEISDWTDSAKHNIYQFKDLSSSETLLFESKKITLQKILLSNKTEIILAITAIKIMWRQHDKHEQWWLFNISSNKPLDFFLAYLTGLWVACSLLNRRYTDPKVAITFCTDTLWGYKKNMTTSVTTVWQVWKLHLLIALSGNLMHIDGKSKLLIRVTLGCNLVLVNGSSFL